MKLFHKTAFLIPISLGFLGLAALILNAVILITLFPQVVQLAELDPSWESYGVVVGINIIILTVAHLACITVLMLYLIRVKKTSFLTMAALSLGIISGIMLLGDMALLSDIGKEYALGLQTRGEWIVLFISYGLHAAALTLSLTALFKNLPTAPDRPELVIKDEALFISLLYTGVISGWLGLAGTAAGMFASYSTWIMVRIIPMLGLIILAPYLTLLTIWLFRRFLSGVKPGLDEKQDQDLSRAALRALMAAIPILLAFYVLQIVGVGTPGRHLLWFPLLLFSLLTVFSHLSLRYYRI